MPAGGSGHLRPLHLGHEIGQRPLRRALGAGETLMPVLHATVRVATDVDAQLVDVRLPHDPWASRRSIPSEMFGGMLGETLPSGNDSEVRTVGTGLIEVGPAGIEPATEGL